MHTTEEAIDQFEAIGRLTKDMRAASKLLGRREARWLVDLYYQIQDFRIQAAGQIRSSGDEPNKLLQWVLISMERLEGDIQKSLGDFGEQYAVGKWLRSICGIGPVITAGLLAHLDVRGCETAGHFWSFAGLDPSKRWEKKTKRPWNAKLKVLLWKAGESFVKVQSNKNDFYGKLFVTRKAAEWKRNLAGEYAPQAAAALAEKNYGADTNARAWYEGRVSQAWASIIVEAGESFPATMPKSSVAIPLGVGMLPPAHIHARARRWTEKLFLSHVHHAMYVDYNGTEPPMPFGLERAPGDHRHYIAPPNWPHDGGGESLRELFGREKVKVAE